ncbi:MAG: RluA family pseudouridine synthase [Saprospiraceae bacterium]|nr:RluA family pseudouridine synthase [Saprospiraceae bacterium]
MQIIFEDYYLLAVNKPAGLSSESGKERHPSAEQEALMYFTQQLQKNSSSKRLKETPYLRAVHRLDRASSGVLVFAKTKQALSALMLQFEQRSVEKVYQAVVEKKPPSPSGHLANWLLKDESGRKALISEKQVKDSQHCLLDYTTLPREDKTILLEVHPATGRFHQIRAQLAHIGCPIAGDVLYGGKPWQEHQIKLHAQRLRFTHPKTGAEMTLEAPLPEGF